MQKLTLFKTLTTAQFNGATTQFTGVKATENNELFINWIANCVHKYFEHKDMTHLNRVLEGARLRGVYRDYLSFAQSVSAHEWTAKDRAFTGTMDKDKMESMTNVNDDDVMVFEQKLYDLLTRLSEKAQAKEDGVSTPLTKEQVSKRMTGLFTSGGKAGLSLDDMDKLYFEIRKDFEVSKLKAA